MEAVLGEPTICWAPARRGRHRICGIPARDCRDTIQRHFQLAGAHCRPNIEQIVRWTLRDGEMDRGLQEVEQGLDEVIAEIEGEL